MTTKHPTGGQTGKWLGGTLLAGLCLLSALMFWQQARHAEDAQIRQKLDSLLGQTESLPPISLFSGQEPSQIPEEQEAAEESVLDRWFREPFARLPQTLMEMGGGLKVNETQHAYVLSIPLTDPQEAAGVDVQVSPHRIQVSGKRSIGKHGSASFMQSFSTSSEVLPQAMTRQVQEQALVITIPKKQGRAASSPGTSPQEAPAPTHSQPSNSLNPEALEELLEKESRAI